MIFWTLNHSNISDTFIIGKIICNNRFEVESKFQKSEFSGTMRLLKIYEFKSCLESFLIRNYQNPERDQLIKDLHFLK